MEVYKGRGKEVRKPEDGQGACRWPEIQRREDQGISMKGERICGIMFDDSAAVLDQSQKERALHTTVLSNTWVLVTE